MTYSLPATLSLTSNQEFDLHCPGQIYQLDSGKLAIFVINQSDGDQGGLRHYWFTLHPGQWLWGWNPRQKNLAVMAIALEDSNLTLINLEDNDQENHKAILEDKITDWLDLLGKCLVNRTSLNPLAPNLLDSQHSNVNFTLAKNTLILGSNTPIWMQLNQGILCFLGQKTLSIHASPAILPCYLQQWFLALETSQLTSYTNLENLPLNAILNGINCYQDLILWHLENYYTYEAQQALTKLQKRVENNEKAVKTSLANLADVFNDSQSQDWEGEGELDPLLKTMGKIGRFMGVRIKRPQASEDLSRLKNPLEAIIRASRLQMRSVLLTGEWWQQDNGPLLAYNADRQPLALLPLKPGKYVVYDPQGDRQITIDKNNSHDLEPLAFMFYRTFPEGTLNIGSILKFAFKGRYGDLLLIIVCVFSATVLNMLTPILIGTLFNSVIPDAETGLLLQIGIILIASTISSSFFKLTQGFTLLRLETASDVPVQAAVWDRVLQLQTRFFRDYSSGDLQSRISGVTSIRRQLSGSTVNAILSGVFVVMNLGLMLYYSWGIALLGLIAGVTTIALTVFHGYWIVKQNRQLLNLEGALFGKVVQVVNSVSKLRITGAQNRAFAYWAEDYRRQVQLNFRIQLTKNSLALGNNLLSSGVVIALFWFAYGAMKPKSMLLPPQLSVGSFMAANAAMGTFLGSITNLSNTFVGSLDILNLWERTQPILKAPLEVDRSKIDPGKLHGKIKVQSVTFRYREDQLPILNNVSLTINPGDFVALVGATGCGKSTLLRLLLGFETPESGAIYYDDQDLEQLNIQAVRRQLGVVLQTSRLQSASLFDSIAGGALITVNEAWEAAEQAGFAEDIKKMPMGMNTVVSEGGTNLSGGQRQRLLIAKALVLKPKILLFDEATSALDNQTQAQVTESLARLNVSRFIIAHRLSTIISADRIYVLEKGSIVQEGTFATLAHQPGLFAQLTARQML